MIRESNMGSLAMLYELRSVCALPVKHGIQNHHVPEHFVEAGFN